MDDLAVLNLVLVDLQGGSMSTWIIWVGVILSLHHLRPVLSMQRLHPNTHTALLYSTQKAVRCNPWGD